MSDYRIDAVGVSMYEMSNNPLNNLNMGNIFGSWTKRHNNSHLPKHYRQQRQRSHINNDVPLIPIKATRTVSNSEFLLEKLFDRY